MESLSEVTLYGEAQGHSTAVSGLGLKIHTAVTDPLCND